MITYVFYLEVGKARIMERVQLPASMPKSSIQIIYEEWCKGKQTGSWWKEGEEKHRLEG